MNFLSALTNLDLLSVGIAMAAIGILGFIVLLSNRHSITNRTFFFFALAAICWSIVNYASYQTSLADSVLWLFRLIMFTATWYSFGLFQLFYVFPEEKIKKFPGWYKFGVLPGVFLTSLITLTPFVIADIAKVANAGEVSVASIGPGIFLFGAVVVSLIVGSFVILGKKIFRASGIEKTQYKFILVGALITFALHIVFNFLLPAFFDNPRFLPLGALFIFPLAALTAYAIFKHHLLSIKVIGTEILAFVLAVTSLFEIIISNDPGTLVFRSGVFLLTLGFGILLIRSVLKEVEQREELERLNQKLKEANMQLDELSHFKTQLLSLASHQVKAPLAAIKGFAGILLQGLYGKMEPKIRETIEKMKNSSDSLIQLVDTLLSVRQIEEGRMQYSFEKVKFKDLVQGVIGELEPIAKGKGLELKISLSGDGMVSADLQKLRQVVVNLIDNAIKYTPEGSVTIELHEDAGWLEFSVKDSGLGINQELIPHLFEEFIREERIKKQVRGTGLGLFIARKIVEAHGGSIRGESEGEGKGSKFYVRLRRV